MDISSKINQLMFNQKPLFKIVPRFVNLIDNSIASNQIRKNKFNTQNDGTSEKLIKTYNYDNSSILESSEKLIKTIDYKNIIVKSMTNKEHIGNDTSPAASPPPASSSLLLENLSIISQDLTESLNNCKYSYITKIIKLILDTINDILIKLKDNSKFFINTNNELIIIDDNQIEIKKIINQLNFIKNSINQLNKIFLNLIKKSNNCCYDEIINEKSNNDQMVYRRSSSTANLSKYDRVYYEQRQRNINLLYYKKSKHSIALNKEFHLRRKKITRFPLKKQSFNFTNRNHVTLLIV